MKGSKEVLWTVVISAALITAGLILGCGDDGGVSCKDVCEKFEECEILPGEDVDDCINGCEEDFDPADEGDKESMECIVDTDCDDLKNDCLCLIACEKIVYECEDGEITECLEDCEGIWNIDTVFCVLDEACEDIGGECIAPM